MSLWMQEHPYLFFVMFLFSIFSLSGSIIEISKNLAQNNKKDDKE